MSLSLVQALELLQSFTLRALVVPATPRPIARVLILQDAAVLPELNGGEFALVSNGAFPAEPARVEAWLTQLAAAQVAALMLPTGRELPRVPFAVIARARALDLALLECHWGADLGEITARLDQAIISRQYQQLRQSELIHQTLTALVLQGKGIHDVGWGLARVVNNTVVVESREGEILVHADVGAAATARAPKALLAQLAAARQRRTWHTVAEPAHLGLAASEGDPQHIVCPIRVGSELFGFIHVLATNQTISELDLVAAQHGATVLALEIVRQRSMGLAEERLRATFVDILIHGEYADVNDLRERAWALNFDLRQDYRVGILDLLETQAQLNARGLDDAAILAARKQLRERAAQLWGSQVFWARSSDRTIFLYPVAPSADALEALRAGTRALTAQLPDWQIYVALGALHPGLTGIRRSYQEASQALQLARLAHLPAGLLNFQELAVYRLLASHRDPGELEAFAAIMLGPLRAAENANLLETLEALAASDFNQKATSQKMYLHINSLRYRIARIEQLTGLKLNRTADQLLADLALKATQLLEPKT